MTFSTGTNSSSVRVEWNEIVVLLLSVLSDIFQFFGFYIMVARMRIIQLLVLIEQLPNLIQYFQLLNCNTHLSK